MVGTQFINLWLRRIYFSGQIVAVLRFTGQGFLNKDLMVQLKKLGLISHTSTNLVHMFCPASVVVGLLTML